MSLVTDDALKEALHTTIAKQILEGLDSTHRDKLLQKAMVDVVKSFDFRHAIDKVAAEKAAAVAYRLMESEDWTARVEQTIREGFDEYLQQLRGVLPEAMKRAFHGQSGSYSNAAAILYCWPKQPNTEAA